MDPNDRDIIARTIVGEAANQPLEGQQAVANVILNRLRSGKFGGSVGDVVFAPYQFEPWQTRKGELMAISQESPAYQRAIEALTAAEGADPTGGATHFLEPNIVRQRRGGTLPNWAQGPSTQIGNHLFFNPGGGGPVKATNATPYAAPAQPIAQTQSAPRESDLGGMIAMLAPNEWAAEPLTSPAKAPQIGPFAGAGEDSEIDPAMFQPRRPRVTRSKPLRT